jgi:hypothetical protein
MARQGLAGLGMVGPGMARQGHPKGWGREAFASLFFNSEKQFFVN